MRKDPVLARYSSLVTRHSEMRLFTIGHSNIRTEEFLDLLSRHGVEMLVDVRTDQLAVPPRLVDCNLSRAQLTRSPFGLTDEQLDTQPPEGSWTVRQTIEHALGSEHRSISALGGEYAQCTRDHSGNGA